MTGTEFLTEVPLNASGSERADHSKLVRHSLNEAVEAMIRDAKDRGHFDVALDTIEAALLKEPSSPALHWRLGELFRETKRFGEAKDVFERGVAGWPADPEFRAGLGATCQELKQLDEAVEHFEKLVTLRADNAADWNNLGIAHGEKKAMDRAMECYRQAIKIDSKYAFAWNNLGNALGYVGQCQESIHAFDEAILIRPDYAEAYNNRAVTRTQLEDHDGALDDYAQALHFRADYSEAHTNRSLLMLLLGRFQIGWTEYEWRWKGKDTKDRNPGGKRWNGGPLLDKKILLYAEQGLGDTIQFVRYARELKNRGATVFVECQRPLAKLLSRSPGVDAIFHRGQDLPPIDYHVPMLSAPGLMDTSLTNMPSAAPYVISHPGLTQKWSQRLSRYADTFNVGIVWQGNPQHRGDRKRSIPLKSFAPLAAVQGIRLFSLQKGHGLEQIRDASAEVPLLDLSDVGMTEDGFLRTAAIVKNLDLVVTADTSVAHLAGAMGVPVWIAMSTACDWRWLLSREDSPWYPSLRLFRQRQPGDWAEVFDRIVAAVQPLVAARARRSSVTSEDRERASSLYTEATRHMIEKQPAKAQPLLERAATLDPESVPIRHDLGLSHLRQQHHADAVACFISALDLDKDHPDSHANLGASLMHLKQYQEAARHLKDAVRLGASSPAVHNNFGAALAQLGDYPKAEVQYHTALRLRPNYPGAHFNLSHALFAQGKIEEAWGEHEWRWKLPGTPKRNFKQPRWAGERLDGRTIFVYAEQSVEDAILFLRFAESAKERGGRVVLECPPPAVKLVKSCPLVDDVLAAGATLPDFDVQIALMSIPGLFRTSMDRIPANVPYIFAGEAATARGEEGFEPDHVFKIGVASQGVGEYPGDTRNDLPASLVSALAALPGVKLVNLQSVENNDSVELSSDTGILPASPNPEVDLAELASLMQQLDLIVSADNAVAHAAGALGLEVWTFLRPVCHWRWFNRREETPWYPRMRLLSSASGEDQLEPLLAAITQSIGSRRESTCARTGATPK